MDFENANISNESNLNTTVNSDMTEENNNLDVTNEVEGGKPQKYDIFAAHLGGLKYQDIGLALNHDDIPVIQNPAIYWAQYGESYYHGDKKRFNEDYREAVAQRGVIDQGFYANKALQGRPASYKTAGLNLETKPEPRDTNFMAPVVGGMPMASNEELAVDKGYYMELNPETKKYEKKELTWWDVHNPANPLSVGSSTDDKGNPTGDPVLYRNDNSVDNAHRQLLSIWGPQHLYGESYLDSFRGFFNAAVPGTVEAIAGGTEFLDYWIKRGLGATEEEASHSLVLNQLINFANRLKYKPSAETEQNGWFGSLQSFSYQLGAGVGMMMGIKGIGKLAFNTVKISVEEAEKLIAKGTAQNLIRQEGKNGAIDYFLAKGSSRLAQYNTAGVMAAQGAHDMFTEAKANGISDDNAMKLAAIAAPFMYITDKLLVVPALVRGVDPGSSAMFKNAFKEQIRKVAKEQGKEFFAKDINNLSLVQKALRQTIALGKQGVDFSMSTRGLEGAMRMGTQMVMLDFMNAAEKAAYNATGGVGHIAGQGAFDDVTLADTMKKAGESFLSGAILGGIVDGLSGRRQKADIRTFMINAHASGKSDWLKSELIRMNKKGVGFRYEEGKWNGKIFDDKPINPNDPNNIDKSTDVSDNENPQTSKITTVDTDGLEDYGFKKGDKLNTFRDVMFYNIVLESQVIKQFVDSTGVTDPILVKKYMDTPSLPGETMDIAFKLRKVQDDITTKTNEIEGLKAKGEDLQLKNKQDELTNLQKNYQDLRSKYSYNMDNIDENTPYSRRYRDLVTVPIVNRVSDSMTGGRVKVTPEDIQSSYKDNADLLAAKMARMQEIEDRKKTASELSDKVNGITINQDDIDNSFNDAVKAIEGVQKTASDKGIELGDLKENTIDKVTELSKQVEKLYNDSVKSVTPESLHEDFDKNPTEFINGLPEEVMTEWFNRFDEKGKQRHSGIETLKKALIDIQSGKTSAEYKGLSEEQRRDNIRKPINDIVYDENTDNKVVSDFFLAKLTETLNSLKNEIDNGFSGNSALTAIKNLQDIYDTLAKKIAINVGLGNMDNSSGYKMSELKDNDLANGVIGNKLTGLQTFLLVNEMNGINVIMNALKDTIHANELERPKRDFERSKRLLGYNNYVINRIINNRKLSSKLTKIDLKEYDKIQDSIINKKFSLENFKDFANAEKVVSKIEDHIYQIIGNDTKVKEDLIDEFEKELSDMVKNSKVLEDTSSNLSYNSGQDFNGYSDDVMMQLSLSEMENYIMTGIDPFTKTNFKENTYKSFYTYYEKLVINNLNNILDSSSTDFHNELKTITDQFDQVKNANGEANDYYPSAQQEAALRMVYSLIHGKTGFMAPIACSVPDNNGDKIFDSNMTHFDIPSITILGNGGAGKSSVIAKLTFNFIANDFAKRGKTCKMLIVAPSEDNIKDLKERCNTNKVGGKNVFNIETLTTDDYIQKLKDNQIVGKNYDYIMVDEISKLSGVDMFNIERSYRPDKDSKENVPKTKYIFLGDPKQSVPDGAYASRPDIPVTQYSPAAGFISEKFRTDVADVHNLLDTVSSSINGFSTGDVKFTPSHYDKDMKKGVFYVKNGKDAINKWIEDSKKFGDERTLIVRTSKDANDIVTNNLSKLGEQGQLLTKRVRFIKADKNVILLPGLDPNTVQGASLESVYVAFDAGTDNGERKDFNTAIGRTGRFICCPGNAESTLVDAKEIIDYRHPLNKEDIATAKQLREQNFIRSRERLNILADTVEPEVKVVKKEEPVKHVNKVSEQPKINNRTPEEQKNIEERILNNQKNVTGRTDDEKFYVINGEEYKRVTSVIPNDFDGDTSLYESSRTAGTTVDGIIRNFFNDNNETKPENISDKAYKDLITGLRLIKTNLEKNGERFLTNNLVVYDKNLKIAGELDILSIDKDGNFNIYDIKTSTKKGWKNYNNSYQGKLTKKQNHTNQLSAYANLFYNQYGIKINKLGILPIEISYDKNGYIDSLTKKKGIKIDYDKSIEKYIPLSESVNSPNETVDEDLSKGSESIQKDNKPKTIRANIADIERRRREWRIEFDTNSDNPFCYTDEELAEIIRVNAEFDKELDELKNAQLEDEAKEKPVKKVPVAVKPKPEVYTTGKVDQKYPEAVSGVYYRGTYKGESITGTVIGTVKGRNKGMKEDIVVLESGELIPISEWKKSFNPITEVKPVIKDLNVDDSNGNEETNAMNANGFLKSAMTFANNGNRLFPISLGIETDLSDYNSKGKPLTPEEFFNGKRIQDKLSILKNANSEFRLRFYKEITLLARNGKGQYEPQVMKNVVTIVDGNDKVIGCLYRPFMDMNNKYSENSKFDFEPEFGAGNIELTEYNEALRQLFKEGVDNANGNTYDYPNATIKFDRTTQPVLVPGEKNTHTSFEKFFEENKDKVSFARKNTGTGVKDVLAELSIKNDPAMVQYCTDVSFEDGNSARVFLYSPFIDENTDWSHVEGELTEILENATRKDSPYEDLSDYSNKIQDTDAFKILLLNKKALTDGKNKDKISKPFEGLLKIKNGSIQINSSNDLTPDDTLISKKATQEINNLRECMKKIKQIAKEGNNLFGVIKMDKDENGKKTNRVADPSKMLTNIKEIHYPIATFTIDNLKPETGKNGKFNKYTIGADNYGMSKSFADNPVFQSEEKARENLRKILGENFLNGKLEFAPSVRVKGDDCYGAVKGFKMILESVSGRGVLVGAERHETVHYVLHNFIDPRDSRKILDASKELMSKEKNYDKEITDDQAEEWLAEKYRLKDENTKAENSYKGLTGIVKHFIDWVSNLFTNTKKYSNSALAFMDRLDDGYYKDMDVRDSINPSIEKTMIHDESMLESTDDPIEDNYKKSKLTKKQMIDIFGDEYQFERAKNMIKAHIVENCAGNRDLDDTVSYKSIKDVFDKAFDFNKEASDYFHAEKFEGKSIQEIDVENDAEKVHFLINKLCNRDVFDSVINDLFPTLSMDGEALEKMKKSGYGDSTQFDIGKMLPGMLKIHLTTIPYKEVVYNKSGFRSLRDVVGRTVRFKLIDSILRDTAIIAQHKIFEEGLVGDEAIRRWFEIMKIKADKGQTEDGSNETANAIYSFLNVFEGAPEKNKLAGHSYIANCIRNEFKKRFKDSNLTFEEQKNTPKGKILWEKFNASTDLINALWAHYSSLQNQVISDLKVVRSWDSEDNESVVRFTPATTFSTEVSTVLEQYKSYINWFIADGDYIPELEKYLDGKESCYGTKFKVDCDFSSEKIADIYANIYVEGKLIFRLNNAPGLRLYQRGMGFADPNINIDDLRPVFRFFHLKLPNSVLNFIDRNILDPKSTGKSNNTGFTRDDLGYLLGNLFLTLKANYDPNVLNYINEKLGNRNRDKFSEHKESLKPQDQFNMGNSSSRSYDEELKDEIIKKNSVPRLDAWDIELRKLATLHADINGVISKDFIIGAEGNKFYKYILSNFLSKNIGNKSDGEHYGRTSFSMVLRMLEELKHANNLDECPLAMKDKDGNLITYDPILNGQIEVNGYDLTTGVRDFNGTGIDDYNERDYYNTVINGWFLNSVTNRGGGGLNVCIGNMGDAKLFPVLHVGFRSKYSREGNYNGSLTDHIQDNNGQVTTLRFNNRLFNEMLHENFLQKLRAADISMKKWERLEIPESVTKMPGRSVKVGFNEVEQKIYDDLLANKGRSEAFKYKIKTLSYKLNKIFSTLSEEQRKKLINHLSLTGFDEFRDYIVKDGKLQLGDTTTMNHDIFNVDNAIKFHDLFLKSKYQDRFDDHCFEDDVLSIFRDRIFAKRYKNLHETLTANGIKMSKRLNTLLYKGEGKVRRESKAYLRPLFDENGKNLKDADGFNRFQWHPFYKAFLYTHFITNESINNLILGPSDVYKNELDKSKRNKGAAAMGVNCKVNGYSDLNRTSKIVKISDQSGNWNNLKLLFGKNGKLGKLTDGSIILSPLEKWFIVKSTGGEHSMIGENDATLKRVGYSMDYLRLKPNFVKSSELVLNGDLIDKSVSGHNIMRYFLTGGHPENTFVDSDGTSKNLYDKYMEYRNEGLSHSEAVNELGEFIIMRRVASDGKEDLLKNTVSAFQYGSTTKSDSTFMNDFDITDPKSWMDENGVFKMPELVTCDYDNENVSIQLNPTQEDFEVKRMSQTEKGIGLMDRDAMQHIQYANSLLAQRGFNRIQKAIDATDGKDANEKFVNYLRKITLESSNRITSATSYIQLFSDPKISMQFPILSGKAIIEYITKINESNISKRDGRRLVQQHDGLITYVKSKDEYDNEVYKELSEANADEIGNAQHLEMGKFLDATGADVAEKMQRELDEKGIDINDETKKDEIDAIRTKYRKMIARIIPRQCVIPADILQDFIDAKRGEGHKKNLTLNDLLTIKVGGKLMNVRSFVKAHSEDYFNSKRDGFRALSEELKGKMSDEERSKTMNYYMALLDKLELYAGRIPQTMPSAAGIYEVTGLSHDSKGVIYTSPYKSILDGSDYDVDELTTLWRHHEIDKNGNFTITGYDNSLSAGTSDKGINNYIFDQMYKTYLDPKNAEMTNLPLEIDDMRDKVAKSKSNLPLYDNDITTYCSTFINSVLGKSMVARYASTISNYCRLFALDKNTRSQYINGFSFDDSGRILDQNINERVEYVIVNLAKILQASVDNAKEMILGFLDINKVSGNIVASLVMSNKTLPEIYDFLNHPSIKSTIREVNNSQSVDLFTQKLLDTLRRKIRTYDNLKDESTLESKKEAILRSLQSKKDYYEKRLELKKSGTIIENDGEPYLISSKLANEFGDLSEKDIMDNVFSDYDEFEDLSNYTKEKWEKRLEEAKNGIKNIDGVIEKIVEEFNDNSKALETMLDMTYKGESLRRLNEFSKLDQGFEVKPFELFKQINDLEFNAGMTLHDLLDPTKTDTDLWKQRALPFKSTFGSKTVFYKNKTQEDVNNDSKVIFDSIFGNLDTHGMNIRFISGGQTGFEQGLTIAALQHQDAINSRYNDGKHTLKKLVSLIMPNGYRYKNGNGVDFYSYSDTNVNDNLLNRIPGIEKNDVKQTKDRGFNESKAELVKAAHVTLNVYSDPTAYSVNFSDKVAKENHKTVLNINVNDNNRSRKVEIAKEDLQRYIDDISKHESHTNEIVINLAGNSLFDINYQKKSESEIFLEDETKIRDVMNIAEIVRRLPDLRQYVKMLSDVNDNLGKVLFQYSPHLKEEMRDMFARQQQDMTTNKEQFYTFHSGVMQSILDIYFAKMERPEDYIVDLKTENDFGEDSKTNVLDLRDKFDRDFFTVKFSEYVDDQLHNADESIRNNNFMKSLSTANDNVALDDNLSYNESDISRLRFAFNKLPEDLKRLFRLYNVMRYNFDYKKGCLTDVIDNDMMRDVSGTIDDFTKDILSPENNETKDNLHNNTLDNILIHNNCYWRRLKKLNEKGVYPKYGVIKAADGKRDILVKDMTPKELWNDSITRLHKAVGDTESRKCNTLSFYKSNEVSVDNNGTYEVVNLVGLDQMKKFRNTGQAEKPFRNRPHGYKDGQLVYVDGKLARVSVPDGQNGRFKIFVNRVEDKDLQLKRNSSSDINKGRNVTISNSYRKNSVSRNLDYLFTDNAEAYTYVHNLMMKGDNGFPYAPNTPKINVSDVNGTNTAGIRTDSNGLINENAYGVVVKKYQHDKDGKFVAQEGTFKDTNSDFDLFKTLNNHVFERLRKSDNPIVIPSQFALGKSALPKRFAEWLSTKLKEEIGVNTVIQENSNSNYSGYGLKVVSVDKIDLKPNGSASKPLPDTRSERITKRAFITVFNAIKRAFPNIDMGIVDNETTERPNTRAYIDGKRIIYNIDMINYDTPFHELGHPMLAMFRDSGIAEHKTIYDHFNDLAEREIMNKSDLYNAIKEKYPELEGQGLQDEIAATLFGFTSVEKVAEFVTRDQRTVFEKFKDSVHNAYKKFVDFIRTKILGLAPLYQDGEKSSLIAPDDAWRGVFDQLLNNVLTGKNKGELSDLEIGLIRQMKDANSKPLDKIDNIKDFSEDLLSNKTRSKIEDDQKDRFVNKLLSNVLRNGNGDYTLDVNGKKFEFENSVKDDQLKNNQYESTREAIRKQVIPEYEKLNAERSYKIVNFLNNDTENDGGGRMDNENFNRFFKVENRLLYSKSAINKFKIMTGFNTGCEVRKLSDLGKHYTEFKGLDAFSGEDTLVFIHHKEFDKNGKLVKADISLFNTTNLPLYITNKSENNDTNIFCNYIDDRIAGLEGVTLESTLPASQKLQLAMQFLKLKDSMPSLNLRRIGTIGLYNDDCVGYFGNMNDLANNVKAIKNIPELYNKLNPEIRDLLNKESLFKQDYSCDFLLQIRNSMQENLDQLEETGILSRARTILSSQLRTVDDYLENVDGADKKVLKQVLTARKEFLRSDKGLGLKTMDSQLKNGEYAFICSALNELEGWDRDPLREKEGKTGMMGYFFTNAANYRGEILQNVHAIIRDTLAGINGVHIQKYINGMSGVWKVLNDRYKIDRKTGMGVGKYFVNDAEARFKRLWIYNDDLGIKVYDKDGKETRQNMYRIHWNPKTAETAKALSEGRITIEEVEAGAKLAQHVEDMIKDAIRHETIKRNTYWRVGDDGIRHLQEEDLDKAVEDLYSANWEKGMMPVMNRNAGQLVFKGKLWEALKTGFGKITHSDFTFDEALKIIDGGFGTEDVKSIFLGQFTGSKMSSLGGDSRLRNMGLIYDGNIRQTGVKSDVSEDIEHTLGYFTMDLLSKMELEDKAMPAVENARIALKLAELTDGIDRSWTEKTLQSEVIHSVYGERQPTDPANGKAGKALDNGINFLQFIAAFSGTAASIPVATTSYTANWVSALTNSLSNKAGNAFDLFTPEEMYKAIKHVTGDQKLVEKMMEIYQVADRSRNSLVNSVRFRKMMDSKVNGRSLQFFNWFSDYVWRQRILVAQMMHDGTLEAHSLDKDGNLVYDVKKDKRYFNTDGSQTHEQKLLYDDLIKQFEDDPRFRGQEIDTPPLAYSIRSQRRLEWVANEFVVGSYNSEDSAGGYARPIFNAVMQFKKYMNTLIEARIGKYNPIEEGSKRIVVKDSNGREYVSNSVIAREGSYRTLWNMMGNVVKDRSFKEFQNMTELQKFNLARDAQDVAVALITMAIVMGISGAWDEDKKGKAKESRELRAFKNGMLSVVSLNPWEVVSNVSNPIPVLKTVQSAFKLVTGSGSKQDVRQLAPFKGTYDAVMDYNYLWDDDVKNN